jgi:hypothetical protein
VYIYIYSIYIYIYGVICLHIDAKCKVELK